MIEWRGPLPTSNYTRERQGNPINLIVIHWVGIGTLESAEARFKKPNEKSSAHYGIGQDGRIWQWVAEYDTAYHCGNWTKNLLSIGIEHEATTTQLPSEELYRRSAWLVGDIAKRYGIPLDRQHIIQHKDIKPTQCPGTVDIDRIIREAKVEYITREEFEQYQRDVRDSLDAIKTAINPVIAFYLKIKEFFSVQV